MTQRPAFLATAILPVRTLGVGRMTPVALVLLMAVVVTVSTGDVAAEIPATYDPQIVEYIEGIVSEPGTTKKTKTSGDDIWTVTTDVKLVSPGIYHVDTTVAFNDDEPQQVTYEVRINEDGTYRIILEDPASDVTYTDSAEVLGGGTGSSDLLNARISLSDREYGPIGTRLSDSYRECSGRNYAGFSAEVLNNLVVVSWRTTSHYWHGCILPLGFDHVDVTEDSVTKRFTSRTGHYSFSDHYLEPTWYVVYLSFHYDLL